MINQEVVRIGMNKLFKDIRHSDIEAVQAAILKNITVVNEVYNAKAPKKLSTIPAIPT